MVRIFTFLLFFIVSFSNADVLRISDFQVDIYSKISQNTTKKISMTLELVGTDLNDNEAYVMDALNVIVGSFYVEDILTSLGKERFKEAFSKYTAKKHSVDIDTVLILSLKIVNNVEIDSIIQAIQARNLCSNISSSPYKNTPKNTKRDNEILINPNLNNVNQQPIDLNSIGDFGRDFGE
ncbi:hypothetical protein [Campylobacter majalis]|uniref:hypothetical protein n=1 Tax=Campylobacter majalis TaxID=2790656 RepID=UPI003D6858A7